MTCTPPVDRSEIVQKLCAAKDFIAQTVSDEAFLAHPEWLKRYGERGRNFCKEDIRFHLDFLAGAIEAGSPESFADYALWTAGLLDARGIATGSFKESFVQIDRHLSTILSPEEHALAASFLRAGSEIHLTTPPVTETEHPHDQIRLTREVYLAAILSGQRHAALSIVDEALRAGQTHLDIYVDVLSEALRRVGKLWEINKISVAQEHMATAITQYVIASIYPKLTSSGPKRGRMIVTGVSGELHQIGANLVADSMEANRWNVRFLGSSLPHSSILEAVESSSADVLCVSTTISANLPSAADLIRSVRTRLKERAPKIVLGGAAYRFATNFAEVVGGAGVVTDLRGAIALLCDSSVA